jgi:tetratricopeptide (TPR) repeat protein
MKYQLAHFYWEEATRVPIRATQYLERALGFFLEIFSQNTELVTYGNLYLAEARLHPERAIQHLEGALNHFQAALSQNPSLELAKEDSFGSQKIGNSFSSSHLFFSQSSLGNQPYPPLTSTEERTPQANPAKRKPVAEPIDDEPLDDGLQGNNTLNNNISKRLRQ